MTRGYARDSPGVGRRAGALGFAGQSKTAEASRSARDPAAVSPCVFPVSQRPTGPSLGRQSPRSFGPSATCAASSSSVAAHAVVERAARLIELQR